MASKNFSLDLPDNFVQLEARKSVPGVSVGDDQQVGGGGGGGSYSTLSLLRYFSLAVE